MTEKNQEKKQKSDNTIFVGNKQFMNYASAVILQFNIKNRETVILRARGKHTSRAIDVAEAITKRIMPGEIEIKEIKTDSEDFINKDRRKVRVSTIDITLVRKVKG